MPLPIIIVISIVVNFLLLNPYAGLLTIASFFYGLIFPFFTSHRFTLYLGLVVIVLVSFIYGITVFFSLANTVENTYSMTYWRDAPISDILQLLFSRALLIIFPAGAGMLLGSGVSWIAKRLHFGQPHD